MKVFPRKCHEYQIFFEELIPVSITACLIYRVAQKKTEQSIRSIFQDFALINLLFFTLLDRASSSHYINTKSINFGGELSIL